jgi:hypothetical protein
VIRLAVAAAVVFASGGVVTSVAGGHASAGAVIDRTFVCTTGFVGGQREVEVRAHRGSRAAGSRQWAKLPFAVASTGGSAARGDLSDSLVVITAGGPGAATTIDTDFRQALAQSVGTVALSTACRRSSARVALGARGLSKVQVGALTTEYDCAATGEVLVRARASLRSSGRLVRRGGFLRTGVPVESARFAVTTTRGVPLAYAETSASGAVGLFVSPRCYPD